MGKKVLVVDDEPEQIDFAAAVLEENGYTAMSATDGLEGMQKARTEKPDLILLDIIMPEKGGISMYRDLKKDEKTNSIPVIIVTGVTRGERFNELMIKQDLGLSSPEGYIEKPMKPDALLKLVKELLS